MKTLDDVVLDLAVQIVLACKRERLSLRDVQVRVWVAIHDPDEVERRNRRRRAAGYPDLDINDARQIARAVLNAARSERERNSRLKRGLYREALAWAGAR